MIDEHQSLRLPKLEGGELELEVNYNDDPNANECKHIRVKDGESRYTLKREDLTAILLAVGDLRTQKALLPMNMRRVRRVERLLRGSFKAKKNYTVGDTIYWEAPWIDEIPIDDEVLSGNIMDLTKQMDRAKIKNLNSKT
jgi:hypothetical protein